MSLKNPFTRELLLSALVWLLLFYVSIAREPEPADYVPIAYIASWVGYVITSAMFILSGGILIAHAVGFWRMLRGHPIYRLRKELIQ